MKQDRFHTGIGVFIIGALVITIAASITLYNQYLQGKIETYVMFFKGSLNGLDVGSSILYRGVKVGKVNRIELTANKAQTNVAIPVYVEFFVEKSFAQRNNPIQILISNGIVAQISSPALLTGRSTIKLVPADKRMPIVMKKTKYHDFSRFPTQNVNEELSGIQEALKRAEKTLTDISDFFKSKKLQNLVQSITEMAAQVEYFAKDFNKQLPSMHTMIDSFTRMATHMETFANDFNSQLPGATATFNEGLRSIARAADSTKNLTDYLARHPESLLRGKS